MSSEDRKKFLVDKDLDVDNLESLDVGVPPVHIRLAIGTLKIGHVNYCEYGLEAIRLPKSIDNVTCAECRKKWEERP